MLSLACGGWLSSNENPEDLGIPALIHRVEFANRVRSAILRNIIGRNEQKHYRGQLDELLQSLSHESVPDLLTAAELYAGFADYTEGNIWLAQALSRLSSFTDESFWWQGLADVLSAYPANETTFKLASSALSLLQSSRQYAKYPICGFLALFEDRSPKIAQLFHQLSQQPEPGALVSPYDLVMRISAGEWAKRGDPIKAVIQAQRVISPIHRQYTLRDLSKYVQQLRKDERQREAEQLEQALAPVLGETMPRQEDLPQDSTERLIIC